MTQTATILIADDEPGSQKTMKALLDPEGYHLEFADCGEEAITKAQALRPSLIVLDVMMPEMDGFEVCQRLRAMPLLAEVPIIMVTALDDRESLLRGIEAGADDFISKPFDRTELRTRIRTIVRLDRYRRLDMERTKFEWVIQQAQDGYIILDDHDRLLYANSYARLFLGLPSDPVDPFTVEDAFGTTTFLDLAREQYQLEPQKAWTSWMTDEIPTSPRYLVRPESFTSEAFWLQVDILPLPFAPRKERMVRLSDVTAQIKAQRHRRGFHTMISHKLRTPLVGILGSLDLIVNHTPATEEAMEFANMAFKSAKRLHGEVEDVLQYLSASGVLRSGTGCQLGQLTPIIDQISKELSLQTVTVAVPEALEHSALVLSQQAMELICWEILENSIKFHPQHTPQVSITALRLTPERVRIQMQDDGITLSPDQLSQLWIPYYQGEKYSTGEIRGMGLGLAMVAAFVWEVGGECRAYNRKDQPGILVELDIPTMRDKI
ncbi:response regulator [candidate division KSB3 bacterium]|uniref:Response regulator n=1 Tax=candidate division KSB3 bacterium TaxID=2044937 RepID=A0A9D5JXN0_9BACT|nr:response regulator [candidate division KSB3 bacterium]MBD3326138.1 response regulator [candidate division KSB3 bacterium]